MPRVRQSNRPPTILDVAREAAVGVMSVSRVINNHPSVKKVTRDKVMKAIAKIGYAPNDAARMLRGHTGRTIGLVVPDLSDFYATCFHAVQDVANENGFQTMVVATGKSAAVEDRQLESIQTHRIAGLLIVTSGSDGKRLKSVRESGIPIVAMDRPVAGISVDSVLVENREGSEAGVLHLIEHGHKKIACVGFDSGSYTVRERIEGYKQAMRKAGFEPLVFDHAGTLSEMESLAQHWSTDKKRPTAVFTIKRIASVLLIQALHRYKLRVPQDIAMVGFDDFELAEVLGSPLTVVRQPPMDVARAAAELVFKKIAEIQAGKPSEQQAVKMLFPTELVVRGSCGCRVPR